MTSKAFSTENKQIVVDTLYTAILPISWVCAVEIVLLRATPAARISGTPDIDNTLKTLFDAICARRREQVTPKGRRRLSNCTCWPSKTSSFPVSLYRQTVTGLSLQTTTWPLFELPRKKRRLIAQWLSAVKVSLRSERMSSKIGASMHAAFQSPRTRPITRSTPKAWNCGPRGTTPFPEPADAGVEGFGVRSIQSANCWVSHRCRSEWIAWQWRPYKYLRLNNE